MLAALCDALVVDAAFVVVVVRTLDEADVVDTTSVLAPVLAPEEVPEAEAAEEDEAVPVNVSSVDEAVVAPASPDVMEAGDTVPDADDADAALGLAEAVEAAKELSTLMTEEAADENAEEPVERGKGMMTVREVLDVTLGEEELIADEIVVVVLAVAGPTGVGATFEEEGTEDVGTEDGEEDEDAGYVSRALERTDTAF